MMGTGMMMTFVDGVLTGMSLGVSFPAGVLFAECVAATLPGRPHKPTDRPKPVVGVLVPAHNEELHIAATVAAIVAQLDPADRVLVVADNCSDETAARARTAGAEVLERTDDVRRGKGYALAAGIEHMAKAPPEVIILVDADVAPPTGALGTLARQACEADTPVQAIYLLQSEPGSGRRSVISEFAFLVKNEVRPTGMTRMGFPVTLTGTGMALPWRVLKDVNLASGDLVEDMKLGLDLMRAGHAPQLCEDVVFRGSLPDSRKSAMTQRTRWEHGHLSTIRRYVPLLLWDAVRKFDPDRAAAAFDLMVPPLALLVMSLVSVAAPAVAYGLLAHSWGPAITCAVAFAMICGSMVISWGQAGRHLSPATLAGAPLYALWKIPIYLNFFARRKQKSWVRTERAPTAKP